MALRFPLMLGFLLHGMLALCGETPDVTQSFLNQNCLDCHEGQHADGGLDLTSLGELSDPQSMTRWVRLFDRVDSGEMPPPDAGEVDPDERKAFLSRTGDWLRETQRAQHASRGRVRGRRLTNTQLERTLHDLLSIDVPLATLMPDEQRVEGFANIADGQSMSHFQLESHLSVVDAALDEAFRRANDDDRPSLEEYDARRLARANPRRRCRDPEMIDGDAVVWSSSLIFYGRITSTTVRRDGWYRITFSASAVNKPDDSGVWCTVRTGACNSGAPLMAWIGSFEATDKPQERTFDAWIPAGHMIEIRPGDTTLRKARFQGGQVGAGEGTPQKVPGVALQEMTVRRIHPGGDAEQVRQGLFGSLPVKRKRGEFSGESIEAQAAKDQLRVFADRAFRRPIDASELDRYFSIYEQRVNSGDDPIDALRGCYRAILCSPRFLYLIEPTGPLDDHAIATRVSYLLTGSMPDRELAGLANEGKLNDPKVIRSQVERLLQGDGAKRFIEDFSAQWLDLVDIDFTEPDRKLHRDFDIVVQNAMLDETHAFLTEILEGDISVRQLVDSDHTYLNSRLARFYDIDGVEGDELRPVSLDPRHHRGGLMAHGSILKVTANGTNTSPVLRGIWVSERILGAPIPPPPASVPAIEPDIRGAKTIRQQLQKHLNDDQCASCHKNIDPPGFALENFDAAGQWRDRYMAVQRGKYRPGAEIDPSSKLADGREFDDFRQFRDLLLDDVRPIARNVAEKLLVYGTGAPITFADREIVDQIVQSSSDQDYGFRSLLQAVVTSPTFLTK